MKHILLSILLLFFISFSGFAQPPETIYQGNLIVTGFRQNIPLASSGPYPIGFTFTFFGNSYTEFYVSANGLVLFDVPDDIYNTSVTIPTASTPNNYIAPFWDNLSVVDGGNVLYRSLGAAPNRKCIIQFKNMGFDPNPTPLGTFSVILYETSNTIQIQYRLIVDPYSAKSHGQNATIGLENADGSAGTLFAFHDEGAVFSEDAISFSPLSLTAYSINPGATYDGVFLTTNTTLPDPGIVDLISPSADGVIGADHTFEWAAATNASAYYLVLDVSPDLSTASYYNAGTNLSYSLTGLTLDRTYYWAVFSYNATSMTWCEVNRFTTSSAPPLTAVPREVWVAQGDERMIRLQYTGGDGSAKTAIVTSLPAQGQLYQVSGGARGAQITTVPATVTDVGYTLIYLASGSTGNGAGSFNVRFHDDTGDSPEATIKINVSPPGVPNLLHSARSTDVELQFDLRMSDPAGKQNQFMVKVNDSPVTISSAALKTGDPYTIMLTLADPLTGSEAVLVSYTEGNISATTGGLLASFTDQPVTLKAQTITFTTNLEKKYTDPAFGLSATSSSGLTAFSFSSSNLVVATISGTVVSIHSVGTSDITALQPGNETYAPAKYLKILTVEKGDQSITFNPLPEKTAGDADFSPGATASSGLTVSYTSNNTSIATIVSGMIHIVAAGTAVITASQSGDSNYNSATPVNQTLTVKSESTDKTLTLSSVMLQGLYLNSTTLRQANDASGSHWPAGVADHITVELHSATNYSTIVFTAFDVPLSTTGSAVITIPDIYSGSYFITIKHRNSLETVSATAKSFAGSSIAQSFGTPGDVYGGNLRLMTGGYAIYAGEQNHDGLLDGSDLLLVYRQVTKATTGYIPEDVNGDGLADGSDLNMLYRSVTLAVAAITP